MTKNIFTYILAACSSILLSCNTTSYATYSFEQLRAADYTLPSNVRKVVVATLDTTLSLSDYAIILDGDTAVQNRRLAYATYIPGMMCAVFNNSINKSQYLKSDMISKSIPANRLHSMVDSILKVQNADAMILMKDNIYHSFIETPTNSYESQVMVSTLSSNIQFILPNGATRDFQTLHDTIRWYPNENEQYPHYKEIYYSIAEQSGNHFAAVIIPSWETRRRSLLSSKSKSMRDAISWTEKGDWDKARDLWADIVLNGKAPDQARASVNLGLYYERADNELESAMWFSKALDIMQNNSKCKNMTEEQKITQRLFNRAIDRQHEKIILDKQMRISE